MINIATAVFSFRAFSGITESKEKGLLATVLYVTSTYRLVDIYTRAGVGEALALTFLPLAYYELRRLKDGEQNAWLVFSLALSGILQSHILSFVMAAMFTVAYGLLHVRSFIHKKQLFNIVKAAGVFLLLNGWFLVPFLKNYSLPLNVHNMGGNFSRTSASLSQLFDLGILTAGGSETSSTYTLLSGSMPKTPGVVLLLGSALLLFELLNHKFPLKEKNSELFQEWSSLIAGLFFLLLTTEYFPWEKITAVPVLNTVFGSLQFTWRFNVFAIMFLSLSAAEGFMLLTEKKTSQNALGLATISVLLIFSSLFYLNAFTEAAQLCNENMTLANGLYDDLYLLRSDEAAFNTQAYADSEEISIIAENKGYLSDDVTFISSGTKAEYMHIPFNYYRDYKATLEGTMLNLSFDNLGQVYVEIPQGITEGTVHVFYSDSLIEKIADVLSLLTAVVLCFGYFLSLRKKRTVSAIGNITENNPD